MWARSELRRAALATRALSRVSSYELSRAPLTDKLRLSAAELQALKSTYNRHAMGGAMFGRFSSDDNDDILNDKVKDLKINAQKALDKRDTGAFVRVALEAVRKLEELPRTHPLHVSKRLAFVAEPSPFYPVFQDVVSKAFQKAYDADILRADRHPNNNSGRAVSGPRGVGKSHGLKLCAIVLPLLLPLLLPNVVSVYVDYQAMLVRPYDAARAALQHAGLLNDDLRLAASMPALLAEMHHHTLSLMFVGDEICAAYRQMYWNEFHMIATSCEHSIFLADSSSTLRTLVECEDRVAIEKLGFSPQQCLNHTKVTPIPLEPFSTRSQYSIFLKNRYGNSNRGREFARPEFIEGVHRMTGGRIREIMQIIEGGSINSQPWLACLSDSNPITIKVLRRLQNLEDIFKKNSVEDSFDLHGISETDLHAFIEREDPNNSAVNTIMNLLDRQILRKRPAKTSIHGDEYTFGYPYHYFYLFKNLYPCVFISFAIDDKLFVHAFRDRLQKAGMDSNAFYDDAASVIAENNLNSWMELQCRKRALIVLSPNYLERLEDPNSACSYEMRELAAQTAEKSVYCLHNLTFEQLKEATKHQPLLEHIIEQGRYCFSLDNDEGPLFAALTGVVTK